MTEEEIINSLWVKPGQTWDQLLASVADRDERFRIQTDVKDKLMAEGRLACVTFTSYAPDMRMTGLLFATEHGRIQVLDNKPVEWVGFFPPLYTHDPFGRWEELNDKYTD